MALHCCRQTSATDGAADCSPADRPAVQAWRRTLSSCMVSSAMRPLLGSASRSVSRSTSFVGLVTAEMTSSEGSSALSGGAAAAVWPAAAWLALMGGDRSGSSHLPGPPTCSTRTVVQAACHLQCRCPPATSLPAARCSAGLPAADAAAPSRHPAARQPGHSGHRHAAALLECCHRAAQLCAAPCPSQAKHRPTRP